jgi:hypothetical protein
MTACVASWAWPPVSFQEARLPNPSTKGVNLGRQAAARAPDRLIAFFFWAPAACWWARTTLESRKTSSKSASLASTSNTRCHTTLRGTREALVHGVPKAKFVGQISPGRTGAGDPQHRLDKQPVVFGRRASVAGFAGKKILDTLPLVVAKK